MVETLGHLHQSCCRTTEATEILGRLSIQKVFEEILQQIQEGQQIHFRHR